MIKSILVTFSPSTLKANVVFLMNVSKHKRGGVVDSKMIWSVVCFTVKTADNIIFNDENF